MRRVVLLKGIVLLVFCWYAQDLAQILTTQTFPAPEIYAVALIVCATQLDEGDDALGLYAAAVLGGLLLDLRWIGVPGLSAAVYTGVLFVSRWLWFQVPSSARRTVPFLALSAFLTAVMTPFRLFFWDASVLGGRVVFVVAAQWTLTVPVLLIFALLRPSCDEDDSF